MKKTFLFLIVCCLIPVSLMAQSALLFQKEVYISGRDSLPYRLLYPVNYNPGKHYPLILFLHGAGQRGKDNESQLTGIPKPLLQANRPGRYDCFILAPQCAKNDVWVKFPHFPQSLEATKEPTTSARLVLLVMDSLLKHLPLDPQRLYVTGYSMGGEGAFDLLTRRPDLFAAAIPVCAVADTAKAKLIVKVPIWAFHGDQDDVNNVKYTRIMISALKQYGGNPIYTEYPGVKHNSWLQAYQEPLLFDWLFKQLRK